MGLAFLFTRVHPDKAADHPARHSILQAIEANPGIHFKELQRRLGLSKSSAQHHIGTLLRARLVQERRGQGYVCYFPANVTDRRILAAAPLLRAAGARQLFAATLAHPGANAQQLAGLCGLQPSTANYHLHRFAQAGLVVMARSAQGLQVDVTDLGRIVHRSGAAG